MIVKEVKINLSEEEFLNYLNSLNYYEETEILNKCLTKNRPVYFISEKNLIQSSKLNLTKTIMDLKIIFLLMNILIELCQSLFQEVLQREKKWLY